MGRSADHDNRTHRGFTPTKTHDGIPNDIRLGQELASTTDFSRQAEVRHCNTCLAITYCPIKSRFAGLCGYTDSQFTKLVDENLG